MLIAFVYGDNFMDNRYVEKLVSKKTEISAIVSPGPAHPTSVTNY